MASRVKLIPYEVIRKRWEKDPEFRRVRAERRANFMVVKQLVRERIRQGKTQTEVANRAGLKQETISAFESMKREPQLANLMRWAKALGVQSLKLS